MLTLSHRFTEALVRGYRLGFLTDVEFHHITQCDNLDDVKLNLQETDYGSFLSEEASPISPSAVRERAVAKFVSEFEYLRSQASPDLCQFLDFIALEYAIDNVMLLLKATLNNPSVDVNELVKQAHPLGRFKPSTLKTICAFENSADGYSELYQTVLIDTPIGPYFEQFLRDEAAIANGTSGVRDLLQEMPTVKLENTLRKLYLEDFYKFCERMGGESGEIMCRLLGARADTMAINITLNSFGTSLNEPSVRQAERRSLYPAIGTLYPDGTERLCYVENEETLVEALSQFKTFSQLLATYKAESTSDDVSTSIDDLFYHREVGLNEFAFEGQFHYACFYSYVRLKVRVFPRATCTTSTHTHSRARSTGARNS